VNCATLRRTQPISHDAPLSLACHVSGTPNDASQVCPIAGTEAIGMSVRHDWDTELRRSVRVRGCGGAEVEGVVGNDLVVDDDDVLEEQRRYYRARAPEYDDWWQRRGRYDRGDADAFLEWDRQVAVVDAWPMWRSISRWSMLHPRRLH
jgi:hypothetical protein